jgi:hypothetical protein
MPTRTQTQENKPSTSLTPIPDPTILTTQQLQREIATSREVVETKVLGIRDVFDTRFQGVDKLIGLLQEFVRTCEGIVTTQVAHLQELHKEKFNSIEKQFLERDVRMEQASRSSKEAVTEARLAAEKAVAAALQAAKEAVGEQQKSNALAIDKSERSFTKQVEQIGTTIVTMQKTNDDKNDDLKSRVQTIEGQRTGAGNTIGMFVGLGGMVVGFVIASAAVVTLILLLVKH